MTLADAAGISAGASMRPRHKAAENLRMDRGSSRSGQYASMRPRHKAAENENDALRYVTRLFASMRPRHKAAENLHAQRILAHIWEVLQ